MLVPGKKLFFVSGWLLNLALVGSVPAAVAAASLHPVHHLPTLCQVNALALINHYKQCKAEKALEHKCRDMVALIGVFRNLAEIVENQKRKLKTKKAKLSDNFSWLLFVIQYWIFPFCVNLIHDS